MITLSYLTWSRRRVRLSCCVLQCHCTPDPPPVLSFPMVKVGVMLSYLSLDIYVLIKSAPNPHAASHRKARARKKKEKEQKKLAEKLAIEDGVNCGWSWWSRLPPWSCSWENLATLKFPQSEHPSRIIGTIRTNTSRNFPGHMGSVLFLLLCSLFFVALFFVLCSLFLVLCSLFLVLCSLFFVLCSCSCCSCCSCCCCCCGGGGGGGDRQIVLPQKFRQTAGQGSRGPRRAWGGWLIQRTRWRLQGWEKIADQYAVHWQMQAPYLHDLSCLRFSVREHLPYLVIS